jgi:hypothetical protein
MIDCGETPAAKTRRLMDDVLRWHAHFGNHVTWEQVMSDNRCAHVVVVRGDCIRRLHAGKKWSYPQVGQYFQRDHTTIMHHIKQKVVACGPAFPCSQRSAEKALVDRIKDKHRRSRLMAQKWLNKEGVNHELVQAKTGEEASGYETINDRNASEKHQDASEGLL